MAHLVLHPHAYPVPGLVTVTRTRQPSTTSPFDAMVNQRNNSTSSTMSNSSNAAPAAHPDPQPTIRTRSIAYGSAVAFERSAVPKDDSDVILVTVRLSNAFRRGSRHGAEDLPSRPPARSFFRRLSTRMNIDHAAEKEQRYKAIKMPRGEYKKYFRRDAAGNYAGTEPEQEWEEEELVEKYAEYQNVPVPRILS